MTKQAFAALIYTFLMANSALAVPGETIAGPVASPKDPKCKIFMVNKLDGTQSAFWARDRRTVKAGGICPDDYLPGRRVNSTTVDVTEPSGAVYRCDISNNSCMAR
jgi:hypothetical protein